MAQNTYKTYLMYKASSEASYQKLVDIKDYPDLGGSPELLETTTLSDRARTYIPGIEGAGDNMDFTCNYDKTAFNTINGLKDQELFIAVYFGGTEANNVVTPTGADGIFAFKGYVSVYANGGDVNAVREMTVSVVPTTVINFSIPA